MNEPYITAHVSKTGNPLGDIYIEISDGISDGRWYLDEDQAAKLIGSLTAATKQVRERKAKGACEVCHERPCEYAITNHKHMAKVCSVCADIIIFALDSADVKYSMSKIEKEGSSE